jgi:hypothetical protein
MILFHWQSYNKGVFNMSNKGEQIRLVQDAITSLSEKQGKMTIGDLQKETGIDDLTEILHDLDNCGYIYYVNEKEFKKT